MNERIRELSRQVVFNMRDDKHDFPPLEDIVIQRILELREEYDKKLAELIVKECATVILNNDIEKQEDYGVNHPYFGGWERGVIDSCQIIKKHFGVEE